MSGIPRGPQVRRALVSLRKEARACQKQINEQAAKHLAKGDYAAAEVLVGVARTVGEFSAEVDSLEDRWKSIGKADTQHGHRADQRTPAWEYYKPILIALDSLGGRATTAMLINALDSTIKSKLRPGDFDTMSQGQQRWQVMVRRARKHLIDEGLLEDSRGREWQMSAAGRRAAKSKSTRETSSRSE